MRFCAICWKNIATVGVYCSFCFNNEDVPLEDLEAAASKYDELINKEK